MTLLDNGGMIGKTLDYTTSESYTSGGPISSPSYIALAQENSPGSTSHTFSGVSTTGLTSSDTLIVIYHAEVSNYPFNSVDSVNSISVNGNAATIDIQMPTSRIQANIGVVAIARISGITASSVNIAVTYPNHSILRSAVSTHIVSDITSLTVLDTDTFSFSGSSTSRTLTTNVQNGGLVIYATSLGDENDTISWSSATERYDTPAAENNAQWAAAFYLPTVTTSHVETLTISGATQNGVGLAVSYETGIIKANKKNSGIWRADISMLDKYLPPGQQAYTTPGTYSWTAPEYVRSISVVCVGGGGPGQAGGFSGDENPGGDGGGLGWKNNIPVVPGQSYTVVVGAGGQANNTYGETGTNGGDSYFISIETVCGYGGARGGGGKPNGSSYVGDGGGNGGGGGINTGSTAAGGGGGAGGYSGDGGDGGATSLDSGQNGSGGGGGGGSAGGSADVAGAGGGVGILGEGTSGTGGSWTGGDGNPGTGGSSGSTGTAGGGGTRANGGAYGGGGAGADNSNGEVGNGAGGAVRIIWGNGRFFPSTNTGDV